MKKIIIILLAALIIFAAAGNSEASEVEIVNEYREIFTAMTEKDYEALRSVVYWESSRCDCPHETNVAVVETVMNRMLDGGWFDNDSVYDVCHQSGQFVCKTLPRNANTEPIDDAIAQVYVVGRQVLPGTDYVFFATKMQYIAKDHIWVGLLKENGKPKKGKGMYFGAMK